MKTNSRIPVASNPTQHEPSPDQAEVISSVMSWINRGSSTKQVLTFGGYAGTGKTFVVSQLAKILPSPLAFCAYTGKASSVLARKLGEAGIATTNETVRAKYPGGPKPFEPRPYCGTIHGLVKRLCDMCMREPDEYPHTFEPGCKEHKIEEGEEGVEPAPDFAEQHHRRLDASRQPHRSKERDFSNCWSWAKFLVSKVSYGKQVRAIAV